MSSTLPPNPAGAASAKTDHPVLIAGTSLIVGVALSGGWFHYHHQQAGTAAADQKLSPQTLNVLEHLNQPVFLRFYAILPNLGPGDESLSYSQRLTDLLAEVQDASGGKVQVTSFKETAETNAAAATTDGIQAYNLDKGTACFFGIALSSGDHKESLAHLQPEWEPAVQYDLIRAIQRVAVAPPPAPLEPEVAKPSPATLDAIKRLIPDPSAVTSAQASQIFHAEFMKDCAAVAADMETEVTAAQQQVNQAKNGGSADDLASAQKHLLEVELQRGDEMKQVAAELQTRLALFEQMKAATNNAAK